MQVKIKLGKDWWMLPADREFTKKDLRGMEDVPYISFLEAGEQVRFFDIRKKKIVKQILAIITMRHQDGYRPYLKDGSIVFRKA